ncbi:MAG: hypothetical protein GYB67_07625 [Chloroflexi bacterium]|nr:hypothetical protein [Chloroflexota bacterium]
METDSTALIVVGCVLLCLVGTVLLVILQVIGTGLEVIGGIFEFVFGLFGGGPLGPCGCIVGIGVLLLCAAGVYLVASVLATCGTPDAVNFCALFGR